MNFAVYAQQYQQDLRQRLIPFWTAFGLDTLNGGYFCVISAKGEPVSSDKWIAWHAHQSWAFAKLYQQFSQPEHLDYARVGADFLLQYATDAKDNWWSIVDNTGRGVAEVTDAKTEAAAIVAWALMYQLTQEETYAEAVKKTLLKAIKRREKRQQKRGEDVLSGRHFKNISELSAIATALVAAKDIVGEKIVKDKGEMLIQELMKHFWEPRANILLENVFVEGGYSDCLQGRKINAGRVFEAFNAFYELTKILNKRRIRQQLAQHVLYLAETTWDDNYGGFFHWLDIKSLPPSEPEAHFKHLWVQLEACTALLRAYQVLQDRSLLKYWQRTSDYIWQDFKDNSLEGEWIGLLNRHGEPLINLKATPDKSAYHSVKNLIDSAAILETLV